MEPVDLDSSDGELETSLPLEIDAEPTTDSVQRAAEEELLEEELQTPSSPMDENPIPEQKSEGEEVEADVRPESVSAAAREPIPESSGDNKEVGAEAPKKLTKQDIRKSRRDRRRRTGGRKRRQQLVEPTDDF